MIRPAVIVTTLLLLIAADGCMSPMQDSGEMPWKYSTPEEQGFDSEVLLQLLQRMQTEDLDIHSILLMRNDHVFLEVYTYPYGPETLHHAMSVGKSFISALTGIALRDGLITGLEEAVYDSFLEEAPPTTMDPRKRDMNLRHALTMTTGLDVGDDNFAVLSSVLASESWIGETLKQVLANSPGDAFNYASLVSHLIGGVVSNASGSNLMEFGRHRLFDPIGMGEVLWDRAPEGVYFGGGGLWMTPRDMLKFGKLYLDKGRWKGRQVVPKAWVKASTRNQIGDLEASTGDGIEGAKYGYQWWVFEEEDAYAAIGVGGQMILVVPMLDFVAVVMRANPDFNLIEENIMPALRSYFWALPTNLHGADKLKRASTALGLPMRPRSSEIQSEAHRISGKRYLISGNRSRYAAFTLSFGEDPDTALLLLEKEDTIIEILLGLDGLSAFSDASTLGKRPDGGGRIAATAEWIDKNRLVLDIHEIGYPIKESWIMDFVEEEVRVTIRMRGAAKDEWTFTGRLTSLLR